MRDMKGAVTIVTGSATGVGAAAARQLAALGSKVVINYTKSRKEAEETAAACRASGVETLLVQADVGKPEDCQRLIDETMRQWGRIDGLINNAGTSTSRFLGTDISEVTPEDFQRIYAVNVVGAFLLARGCAPHMKASGGGAIVNISSLAGVIGGGSSIAYAASKGALNTMTLALARSLGPHVRVNTVCPGFIQGRWLAGLMGEEVYNRAKTSQETQTPLRRAGTPEDMAEAAVWLIAGAGHVTGEILMVDGGWHLGYAPMKAR
jgi:3-oxoacyl-[acyl-carrier protein] reductase